MARKGKKVGPNKNTYKPLYAHRFKAFMAPQQPVKKKFLGFELKTENNNQLWRWDTLEEVKA